MSADGDIGAIYDLTQSATCDAPHVFPITCGFRGTLRNPIAPSRSTTCGRIRTGRCKIKVSHVFAGQLVGIREFEDRIWLVSFMHYDSGFFDEEAGRVECASNPFGAEVLLPMSPV